MTNPSLVAITWQELGRCHGSNDDCMFPARARVGPHFKVCFSPLSNLSVILMRREVKRTSKSVSERDRKREKEREREWGSERERVIIALFHLSHVLGGYGRTWLSNATMMSKDGFLYLRCELSSRGPPLRGGSMSNSLKCVFSLLWA